MKTRLDQLTIGEFIELLCGDISILGDVDPMEQTRILGSLFVE